MSSTTSPFEYTSDDNEPFGAPNPKLAKPLTVLVIDDNADARSLLVFWLQGRGCRTLDESNGDAGAETAIRERPDLILTDLSMPHTDGFVTARRIRSHEETRHTPIVAITAMMVDQVHSAAIEAGCSEVIGKPVDYERLDQILASIRPREIIL